MNQQTRKGLSRGAAPRAVIADDEPLLLQALSHELSRAWPELVIAGAVGSGLEAIDIALLERPDVLFLDIRMPGATGIEAAQAIVEDWCESAGPAPLLVFVTAYGEFALEAFERAALDFLLKPVVQDRLVLTVERLKHQLATRSASWSDASLPVLSSAAIAIPAPPYLRKIRASVGDSVQLVAIEKVILLAASDKYVLVQTARHEYLIREPLRDLLPQLDPADFAQIHRSSIVNLNYVKAADRAENGKLTLRVDGLDHQPIVSRLYAHLFKAM